MLLTYYLVRIRMHAFTNNQDMLRQQENAIM